MGTGQRKHDGSAVPAELVPLTRWLHAAAKNHYGVSGDGGKVWVLPETFAGVFGISYDKEAINLYCQKSELEWLSPSDACAVAPNGQELLFWYLGKVVFALPVPMTGPVAMVSLYHYPDNMEQPIKCFQVDKSADPRCVWPATAPRFHFLS